MKYNNYKELKKAYDTGELDRKQDILSLDNDQCLLYVGNEKLFEGNGYNDLKEVIDLLGIPSEWV